ncbi:MAG: hypothetical protein B6245_04385 [Desulfobacteraceae bacterium 4572_88]|nr:MAG: hypothetical protein B6245_04385 [Desulfobacteraceae bacterium 4572_88]RLC14065.1 MAG: dialkylrecorsinol condensing enzyme DarA [Deltaproteobacteria bacterium]
MKKILVIYYSQSGQLTDIVRSALKPLEKNPNISVCYEALKPGNPFPFPWTTLEFCDVFPESVEDITCELEPFAFNADEDFDLIILAYQVWYLSPSIPVATFLKSPEARLVMRGRPVLTLIGCRNMWLLAHERVKTRLHDMGARLAGNIVLADRTSNLIGVITIAFWMLTGKKERFLNLFPLPGVSDQDISDAERFGTLILESLENGKTELSQSLLNQHEAVTVNPGYLIFEKRIIRIFKVWSKFILRKGEQGDPGRRPRVRLFLAYLLFAITFFAPLSTLASGLIQIFRRKQIREQMRYFSQNELGD